MPELGDRDGIPGHGGDLAYASARHGKPADGWLDLSTGINPRPYPAPPVAADDLARLPDRSALDRLLAAARRAYGVPDGIAVVATPGSEIVIRLLPLLAPSGRVAIISPTYPSHTDAWANAGRDAIAVGALDTVPDDATIVVLANPNNPDGRITDVLGLVALAERLGARGGLLVVDEAFADLTPEASLIPRLAGLPAVVLRSFGKFYGLAGLRLGFVAGVPALVARLERLLGDWPVSGAAIRIGTAALSDRDWQGESRRHLAADAARLRTLLAAHDLVVIGGTDLFVLVDSPEAAALHRGLAERGIWTRAFAGEPGWLRIGLPGDEAGFARLDRALATLAAPAVVRLATTAPPPAIRTRQPLRR